MKLLPHVQENCHITPRKVAQHDRSVRIVLKFQQYHPYEIKLVQGLLEDDFDRRLERINVRVIFASASFDKVFLTANFC